MKNKKYKGPERRKSVRVTYAPDRKPVLKVGENEFEVADISEMGLRFFNDRKIEFGHWVRGTVKFLCGESIEVEGMIVRKKRSDIYMNVNIPIPKNILMREQQQIDHNHD
jgi:PilZ domain